MALACCLLVGLFVRAERSVDRFHPELDRLRAVWMTFHWFPGSEPSLSTPAPLAQALEASPAVERAVVVGPGGVRGVRVPGREGLEDLRVESPSDGYFDLFGLRLLQGDPDRVLAEPGIVLRQAAARRLFGTVDPIGQTLTLERYRDTLQVAVTGILADSSGRSAIDRGDALLSRASLPPDARAGGWTMSDAGTYLRLAPGATDADLDRTYDAIRAAHFSGETSGGSEPPDLGTIPLADLHLSDVSYTRGFRGNAHALRLFSTVALFVLLLGGINYVNLATARAARRAREVGVRKAVGAGRWGVARQFLTESVVLAGLAGVAAVALAVALRPGFNALFGAGIGPADLDAGFGLGALALALGTGLVAGVYPALVLSGLRPVAALRGGGTGRGAGRLRQTLVVTQLVVAVALLAGTGVVLRQIAFAQTQDPGYAAEGVVAVDLGGPRLTGGYDAAARAVRALPGVAAVAATDGYPSSVGMMLGGVVDETEITFKTVDAEPGYLDALGARLVAGRFIDDRPSDRASAVVLNETALGELGWTVADVGRRFAFNGSDFELVGVVEDQHIGSVREAISPMLVKVGTPWEAQPLEYGDLLVRLRPGALVPTLAGIQEALGRVGGQAEAEVTFLDDAVAALYESERRLGGVLGAFAGVAILIACLGLFGLAAYTAERRTKEIGVRRVLGATAGQIVSLLTRETVALVAVAALVAVPLAVWAMSRWLDGFAYRVALGPGLFAGAVALALAFALVAVGGQAWRAAHADPARALRAE